MALAALAAMACSDNEVTPTAPTTPTVTTHTFVGTLEVGGSRFYSFTVNDGGTVSAMLASVASTIDGTALVPTLEIGVGTPAGTGCAISDARYVAPELVAQLVITSPKGVRCVRVADTGELSTPVRFALRFSHP